MSRPVILVFVALLLGILGAILGVPGPGAFAWLIAIIVLIAAAGIAWENRGGQPKP